MEISNTYSVIHFHSSTRYDYTAQYCRCILWELQVWRTKIQPSDEWGMFERVWFRKTVALHRTTRRHSRNFNNLGYPSTVFALLNLQRAIKYNAVAACCHHDMLLPYNPLLKPYIPFLTSLLFLLLKRQALELMRHILCPSLIALVMFSPLANSRTVLSLPHASLSKYLFCVSLVLFFPL